MRSFQREIVLANEALDFSFIWQIIDGLAGLHKRFLRIPERAWPGNLLISGSRF
jgi:hypothetical protein